MTTPDGIPIVKAVRVERVCAGCGRTYCLPTDDPNREDGESHCVLCVIRAALITRESWGFSR